MPTSPYISLHIPHTPTGRSLYDIGSWREPRTYTRIPYPTCGSCTHTCAPWPTCAAPPHICLHRLRAWRVGLLITCRSAYSYQPHVRTYVTPTQLDLHAPTLPYSARLFPTVNKLTVNDTIGAKAHNLFFVNVFFLTAKRFFLSCCAFFYVAFYTAYVLNTTSYHSLTPIP